MTTSTGMMDVGETRVELVRKDIKNLHVGVYPPSGRVRVAVPLRLSDEAVRLAIISRLGWIRRKQEEFRRQDRQSERELVSGESLYVAGRRYRLDVVEQSGRAHVELPSTRTIRMCVSAGTDVAARQTILDKWYRGRLRTQAAGLLRKWETRVGVEAAELRIRKMKTRWGSCNPEARRIWLNLELAKKPVACLEYILVHELVHLIERNHNDRFREILDQTMPKWRLHRDELNRAPLAHEDWVY